MKGPKMDSLFSLHFSLHNDSEDGSGTPPHPPTILGWSSGGVLKYLSRPRNRPPTPMVIKEIPLKICENKKISRKISCKKFKNHLQFHMKIFIKKISSFLQGNRKIVPKSHTREYFSKVYVLLVPRVSSFRMRLN